MRLAAFAVASLFTIVACGGDRPVEPNTPRGGEPAPGGEPPRTPITDTELRERWAKLTQEETAIVTAIDALARLTPAEREKKLAGAQERAGFLASGLRIMTPPEALAICHKAGVEGASDLKAALDGIHSLWTGKGAATAERKAEADRLAEALCKNAGKLAAARTQCGVAAKVPSPVLCMNSQ